MKSNTETGAWLRDMTNRESSYRGGGKVNLFLGETSYSPESHAVLDKYYSKKKTTGSLLCLPVLFIETDSRMQDQKQKEAPQQVAAENILHPADFCFRFVFLLRLCCLSLNFLFLCFHCSNCSVSCVVLQRWTCVVSWVFLCVSSSLSVVSRSC